MTILHTPNYAIAYIDAQTALADLAAASQDMATTVDAALGRGGVAPYDATSLAAEAAARQAADTTLGNRVTVLEPGAWTDLPAYAASTLTNFTPTDLAAGAGAEPTKMQYRLEGHRVWLRGWTTNGVIAAHTATLSAALPAALRPVTAHDMFVADGTNPSQPRRWYIGTDGQLRPYVATPSGGFLNWNGCSWPIA